MNRIELDQQTALAWQNVSREGQKDPHEFCEASLLASWEEYDRLTALMIDTDSNIERYL